MFGINNNTSSRNTEMAHRLKVVEKILNDMMKSADAWPFLRPVSKRKVNSQMKVYNPNQVGKFIKILSKKKKGAGLF